MRSGSRGLHCWDCAQDSECTKKQKLEFRMWLSQLSLVFMFLGMFIVSIWKGITTFYRWSKTDKVDCWQLRGCVSLFVGTFYVVVIFTPALGVFKYVFFRLPSEADNVFTETANSLFLIGTIGWIILMVIGCCYPLFKCVHSGSTATNNSTVKIDNL